MKTKSIIFTTMLVLSFSLFSGQVQASTIKNISTPIEYSETDVTEEQYLENIAGITELTGRSALNLLKSNETYFLYIGHKSCPYCREFSKVLAQFKTENVYPIYYLNNLGDFSDITSEELAELRQILFDEADYHATPTFLKFENGSVTANFVGSDTTLEDLENINF